MRSNESFEGMFLDEMSLEELLALYERVGCVLDADREDIAHSCGDCGSVELNAHWDGWVLLSNLHHGVHKRVKATTGMAVVEYVEYQKAREKEKGANNE